MLNAIKYLKQVEQENFFNVYIRDFKKAIFGE